MEMAHTHLYLSLFYIFQAWIRNNRDYIHTFPYFSKSIILHRTIIELTMRFWIAINTSFSVNPNWEPPLKEVTVHQAEIKKIRNQSTVAQSQKNFSNRSFFRRNFYRYSLSSILSKKEENALLEPAFPPRFTFFSPFCFRSSRGIVIINCRYADGQPLLLTIRKNDSETSFKRRGDFFDEQRFCMFDCENVFKMLE